MIKEMCLINNNIVNNNDALLSAIDSFLENAINAYIIYPEKILIVFIYICLVILSVFLLLIKKGPIF